MTAQSNSPKTNSIWADEDTANFLRLRVKTFYNADYFERIMLPLMNIPQHGHVLDVGCGYGGLSIVLAELRPDLHITGLDIETAALESAAQYARQKELANVTFEQGDAHRLKYEDNRFDAVVCQTVLTHVDDAEAVVREMARVLKPDGNFMAAEYTSVGPVSVYNSAQDKKRDDAWYEKVFRLTRLLLKGKQALGRGDDHLGVRVPLLATAAGLDVFDVRLNDRVLHVIPPYRHPKQAAYLELLKALYEPDPDRKGLAQNIELMRAAGGTEEDAEWLYNSGDSTAVRQAIADGNLTEISSYMLYLTFARKSKNMSDKGDY
ncbi:MAG: class I SAM-dependent methyltransferase [Anaerolineae bacterium]|nr:class I SAM-dependent methyltransferase [Anaerolineae bacterium]